MNRSQLHGKGGHSGQRRGDDDTKADERPSGFYNKSIWMRLKGRNGIWMTQ